MTNKWIALCLTLAALGLAGHGLAATPAPKTVDEIVLVVDQDAMTKGEMEESIATIFATQGIKEPAPGTSDYQEAKKEVTEGFIREVLMAEEADREKIEIQDGDVDHQVDQEIENMKKRYPSEQEFEDGLKKEGISMDDLKQDVHDQMLRRIKANRILQMKQHDLPGTAFVTDQEVQNYFDQHPKDYEQVKFSIILFRIPPKSTLAYTKEVEKQATGILAQLKGGADFATLAKKYSEDDASAANGGQMDQMYRVDLNPKLADGIFKIPINGMGLVHADDGIYIVKVEHKGTADYDAVAPDIKEHLRKQKQDSAFGEWIEGLKKDAYIVEDGQIVAYQKPASTEIAPKPGNGSAKASASESTSASTAPTTVGDQASASAVVTESADNSAQSTDIYPTLPSPGMFTFDLGAEGFSFATEDLADYYGPSVNTTQGFPFGFGVHLGMDFAIDPSIELGISLAGFKKFGETVNFAPTNGQANYSDQWSATAAGPGLDAKILIPLDESTNFILSAGAGYYFLVGAGVTVVSSAVTENANFGGANFGEEAAAGVEFFFDNEKDSAFDLEVGYRVLKFQPITSDLTVDDNGPYNYPSPLTNADGSKSEIDFSGIHIGLGVRFYLDKGD